MNKLKIVILIAVLSTGINYGKIEAQSLVPQTTQSVAQYINVNPLSIVASPYRYLNKSVRIKGKFDKFSTIGLDYAPAMRSSEKYISFLIQRPDVLDHNIPLSELKIFLKKDVAEKHIDLDSGDEIVFTGKIFSTALGDPWMDVDNFTVLTVKDKGKKNDKISE